MASAEMSLAAVPASTAGNENSRVHSTIHQELKTLADAMFQFAERLTEISHKSLPLRRAIDLLKKIQTDSTQDAANDQAIIDKTDRCMGISEDLISVDKKGLNCQDCGELVRIRKQSPDIAGGADVNEDDLDARAGCQGIVFGCTTDENEDIAPLTHLITTRLRKRLSDVRKNDDLRWFRPNGETQIIDFPVTMRRQVAAIQIVPEFVKLPQTLLIDSTEDIPVVQQSLLPTAQTFQKTRDIPQLQCIDKVVDNPVAQVPRVQVVEKTVEIPQLHIFENTAETQTIHGSQTSESMGITLVGQVAQDRVQQRFGRTATSSSFMRNVSVDEDMKEDHSANDLNDVIQLETSQSQFIDRCVQVPTVLQRRVPIASQQQVPVTRKVQKMNMQRQDSSIQGTQQPHNLNKPQQPAEQTEHE